MTVSGIATTSLSQSVCFCKKVLLFKGAVEGQSLRGQLVCERDFCGRTCEKQNLLEQLLNLLCFNLMIMCWL